MAPPTPAGADGGTVRARRASGATPGAHTRGAASRCRRAVADPGAGPPRAAAHREAAVRRPMLPCPRQPSRPRSGSPPQPPAARASLAASTDSVRVGRRPSCAAARATTVTVLLHGLAPDTDIHGRRARRRLRGPDPLPAGAHPGGQQRGRPRYQHRRRAERRPRLVDRLRRGRQPEPGRGSSAGPSPREPAVADQVRPDDGATERVYPAGPSRPPRRREPISPRGERRGYRAPSSPRERSPSSSPTSRAAPALGAAARGDAAPRSPATTRCCGRRSRSTAAASSRPIGDALLRRLRRPRPTRWPRPLAAQRALHAEPWGQIGAAAGAHGAAHRRRRSSADGDYFGPPLNRVARLLAAGHGGQVLLSQATAGAGARRAAARA